MTGNKSLGKRGETLAADYLIRLGYMILHRNWRHAHCELDIIATKDDFLHFIEVKTLRSDHVIYPEQQVSFKKFRSLKKAANAFLHGHPEYTRVQFDIVSVILGKGAEPSLFLIEDVYR